MISEEHLYESLVLCNVAKIFVWGFPRDVDVEADLPSISYHVQEDETLVSCWSRNGDELDQISTAVADGLFRRGYELQRWHDEPASHDGVHWYTRRAMTFTDEASTPLDQQSEPQ